jgi:hypothetical protein
MCGAAPGGQRYDAKQTQQQRQGIANGIWLCQTCAKLVDSDPMRYPVLVLRNWKSTAEQKAHRTLGKAKPSSAGTSLERRIKRDLKIRDELRKALIKPVSRAPNQVVHPYDKFDCGEVIIRRIDDRSYPEIDGGPGISGWFKVELFDFYHDGIKVVLNIEKGVIGDGGAWDVIEYGEAYDAVRFRLIKVWRLGLIPFRNIRQCDLLGDEYYACPKLYCDFSINGMPYERIEYAVVGEHEYDWPLYFEHRVRRDAGAANRK